MKIRVFQSDKGDCLLLTSKDGRHILADGGMKSSFIKHVAPFLGKMRDKNEQLDLIYVSHIDQDHISGVLRMMDDAMAWKIHKFQIAQGNANHKMPKAPRPPEVKSIWHNSFHEQIGENSGPIEEMLAANAAVLSLRSESWAQTVIEEYTDIATSKREAALLSRRIGAKQMNVHLNPEYGGGLMYVPAPPDFIDIGSMRITVIGPFDSDLKKLRDEWNTWLKSSKGRKQVANIEKKAEKEEKLIGNSEIDELISSHFAFANELGNRNEVTLPNLASLMLLIEEDGHTILMTGDGHCDDVSDGLDVAGALNANGGMHVDVLKIPHHGSENNWHAEFGRQVTADHYVFCGNGEHKNPDTRVVKGIINSRLGPPALRSKNAEVGNDFKLWFNSSDKVAKSRKASHTKKLRAHMKKLEKIVDKAVSNSGGQMKGFFLKKGSSFVVKF